MGMTGNGMNTFELKITALILMVIDHIGLYFEGTPLWFRLLGRGSYPLFLFCMAWGYHYTRNRRAYLLRLYLMSVFMGFFCYYMNKKMLPANGYGNHNIFVPMLLTGLLISAVELYRKDRRKGIALLCGIFGLQVLYYMIPNFLPFVRSLSGDVVTSFIPNLGLNEYGFPFIAMGVLMYFLRDKKDMLCAAYLIFCISQFSQEMIGEGTFYQSFMIIALPFMMKYNQEKGPGMKYFFYIFYPAHTTLLFYLANHVF